MDQWEKQEGDAPREIETQVVVRRQAEEELAIPLISDAQIERAERSVENVKKIVRIALRVTGEHDWFDMGGKPYLAESGCNKVAALFGISLEGRSVEQIEDEIDGKRVIRFVAKVRARFGNRTQDAEGVASSDDAFFGKKGGKVLPLAEVPLDNVRKKALTNAQNRALKKILGLQGLTWEDLGVAKIDRKKIGGVEYKTAKKAPPGRQGGGESSSRIRLRGMLEELADATGTNPKELLRQFTTFTGQDGKEHSAETIDRMSDGWINRVLPEVEKACAQYQGPPDREPGSEG